MLFLTQNMFLVGFNSSRKKKLRKVNTIDTRSIVTFWKKIVDSIKSFALWLCWQFILLSINKISGNIEIHTIMGSVVSKCNLSFSGLWKYNNSVAIVKNVGSVILNHPSTSSFVSTAFYFIFSSWQVQVWSNITIPLDTGRILNVHKTFRRRRLGHLLNVLCTFNSRPLSRRISLVWKKHVKRI